MWRASVPVGVAARPVPLQGNFVAAGAYLHAQAHHLAHTSSCALRGEGEHRRHVCTAVKHIHPDSLGQVDTRAKPSALAEREFNKTALLDAATTWQEVVGQFSQLGDNAARMPGLVGAMLRKLADLLPPLQQLQPHEVKAVVVAIGDMAAAVANSVEKLKVPGLVNTVWSLASLPDPLKLPAAVLNPPSALSHAKPPRATAAAAAAWAANRGRSLQQVQLAVAALGAALLGKRQRVEDTLNAWAGLTLAGYVPPQQVQPDNPGLPSITFAAWLEARTGEHLWRLGPDGVRDAALVATRLVAPGQLSRGWLEGLAQAAEAPLAELDVEPLMYVGYCLARHSYYPSAALQDTFLTVVTERLGELKAAEFPMLLYTVARWSQLHASTGSKTPWLQELNVDKPWLDTVLLGSYKVGALRTLPLSQLVSMLRTLGVLQITPSAAWLQRLWPVATAHLKAEAAAAATSTAAAAAAAASEALLSGSGRAAAGKKQSRASAGAGAGAVAANALGLLSAVAALPPGSEAPTSQWVEEVLGYVDRRLTALTSAQLSELTGALQRLGQAAGEDLLQQVQGVALQRVAGGPAAEWPLLIQATTTGLSPDGLAHGAAVVGAVAAAAAEAARKPALLKQQDATGALVLPSVILRASVAARTALATTSAEAAPMGLTQSAQQLQEVTAAVLVDCGTRLPPGQLMDMLDVLKFDLNMEERQLVNLVGQLLPGAEGAAGYAKWFSVKDSVELLELFRSIGVDPHPQLKEALAKQLQTAASALGRQARAATPDKAAATKLVCSFEEASALQGALGALGVKVTEAAGRNMAAAMQYHTEQQGVTGQYITPF